MFKAVDEAFDVINGIVDTSESFDDSNSSSTSTDNSTNTLDTTYVNTGEIEKKVKVKINVCVENIPPIVSDIPEKVEKLEEEIKVEVKKVRFFLSFLGELAHYFTSFLGCSSKASIEISLESPKNVV